MGVMSQRTHIELKANDAAANEIAGKIKFIVTNK
jgi:hypothetical protein